jgi:glycosyltransferase involved in cell wall biosynthesis
MKVLYSCLSKSWGGMEMYTLNAVKQLIKENVSVELLCLKDSRLHIEANNIGIIIHTVKAGGYIHPAAIIKTTFTLMKNNYSLIHTHASRDLWILVPALFISRKKSVLFLTKHVGSRIVKKDPLHNLLYRRVNRIFAISNVIKKNLIETCPIIPDRISIMPNGVDIAKFNPQKAEREKVRNEFNIKADEIVLGMLARFTPGKGHEEFLKAARELNKDFDNLKYLIVGESSRGEERYTRYIKKLAEEFKLKNIIFAGFRSDTSDVLSAMDIFVFPSHSEAFGIALIEAMAMKIPSVCSSSDGVLDIAVNNVTSILFQRRDHSDLIVKLLRLINSEELRIKLGQNARQRVVEYFNIEMITQKTIDFYNKEVRRVDKNETA